ncbi:MAG: hypothetical protein K2N35_03720, partial [Muribaculaceae bacterium]|nr:hypothetical protein [Muribaculaceae bacterium]
MKRFFLFLVGIFIVITSMAQSTYIVLSYNKGEELRFYRPDQITDAIDKAEVNDTIYFGIGNYNMDYLCSRDDYFEGIPADGIPTINKPLIFIGSGAHSGGTCFYGGQRLIINIDTSLDDNIKKLSFEGISFGYDENVFNIEIASSLQELKFANCRFGENFYMGTFERSDIIN